MTRPSTPITIFTIHYISLPPLQQEARVHVEIHRRGAEILAGIFELTALAVMTSRG
jgi:hypothetical protein